MRSNEIKSILFVAFFPNPCHTNNIPNQNLKDCVPLYPSCAGTFVSSVFYQIEVYTERLFLTYVTASICCFFCFFYPCGYFFPLLSHICGIMLEDGRSKREGVVNLSSYLFGRQVAERWPCKSYWHCGDIHLVYPYSRSRCPFMKTCAICHRVSPWLCSLINLSMWDGGDLLAQHLWPETQGFGFCPCQKKERKKKTVGMAIAVLLTATLQNLHYSELKGAPGSGKWQK